MHLIGSAMIDINTCFMLGTFGVVMLYTLGHIRSLLFPQPDKWLINMTYAIYTLTGISTFAAILENYFLYVDVHSEWPKTLTYLAGGITECVYTAIFWRGLVFVFQFIDSKKDLLHDEDSHKHSGSLLLNDTKSIQQQHEEDASSAVMISSASTVKLEAAYISAKQLRKALIVITVLVVLTAPMQFLASAYILIDSATDTDDETIGNIDQITHLIFAATQGAFLGLAVWYGWIDISEAFSIDGPSSATTRRNLGHGGDSGEFYRGRGENIARMIDPLLNLEDDDFVTDISYARYSYSPAREGSYTAM